MKADDQEYVKHLNKREEICEKIEEAAKKGPDEVDSLLQWAEEYFNTGLVPKKSVRQIQSRFGEAVSEYLKNAEGVDEEDLSDARMQIQILKLKNSPNPRKKIEDTKAHLKKEMSRIRDDVERLKTNIEFLASNSKQGDKIRQDYQEKIDQANEKLDRLNDQYRAIREMEDA